MKYFRPYTNSNVIYTVIFEDSFGMLLEHPTGNTRTWYSSEHIKRFFKEYKNPRSLTYYAVVYENIYGNVHMCCLSNTELNARAYFRNTKLAQDGGKIIEVVPIVWEEKL